MMYAFVCYTKLLAVLYCLMTMEFSVCTNILLGSKWMHIQIIYASMRS